MGDTLMDILEDILDEKEKELLHAFDFKSKFKLIDTRSGTHIQYNYLFKRGLTKEEISFLEQDFFKKSIDVKEISGLELSDFNMKKTYTAVFSLWYYDDLTFDCYLHHMVR